MRANSSTLPWFVFLRGTDQPPRRHTFVRPGNRVAPRQCFSGLALFLLLFFPQSPCFAMPSASIGSRNATVLPQSSIANQKQQIHRLQEGIKAHKNKIEESKEQEQSLLQELEKLDHRLEIENYKLISLKESYGKQEKLLQEEQDHLKQTILAREGLKKYLQKRLTAYYQMGSIGFLNVIFSQRTLAELLSFQEYFHSLVQCDRQAIAAFQDKIREQELAEQKLEQEKTRLQEMVNQVAKEEKLLADTRREKKELLHRVTTEEKLFAEAMSEIEKAAAGLTASLEKLRLRNNPSLSQDPAQTRTIIATATKQKPAAESSFADQKGKLGLPVAGRIVIPSRQGQGQPLNAASIIGGINILPEKKEQIVAVFDGRVVNSGYLRGYGNMIIIDHGQQYYSIVSRAGAIFKEEGTAVARGEPIGITGDDDALLGQGIHFEIRHGSVPENPLDWLNPEMLTFQKEPE